MNLLLVSIETDFCLIHSVKSFENSNSKSSIWNRGYGDLMNEVVEFQ